MDPHEIEGGIVTPISVTWSDYDGDGVYGDFTVTPGSPPTVTNVRSFELGMGTFQWSGGAPAAATVQFYHGNQIGTTRLMTDSSGMGILPVVYTAFGERVDGTQHRYGYAGAWGYQAPSSDDPEDPYLDFPFLHVGARYYDPATGRFLQRDPLGIRAGLNIYAYVRYRPTGSVDPSGLASFWSWGARWSPIGVCGWLAYEFTKEVIRPELDEWIDDWYEEEMERINNPTRGDPPPVPPCFSKVL